MESEPVARCRRFTLGDGMILIAATACWLALVPTWAEFLWGTIKALPYDKVQGVSGWWDFFKSRPDVTGTLVIAASNVVVSFLMPFTLAYLVMRLRKPRPALRAVLAQPGMAAVEALAVSFGIGMIFVILKWPMVVGILALLASVPMSWLVLKLAGRWHPESGWIERFGRGLGVGWMLLIPGYLGLYWAFG